MKFQKQLTLKQVPEWAEHYIDYKKLKTWIKAESLALAALVKDLSPPSEDDSESERSSPVEPGSTGSAAVPAPSLPAVHQEIIDILVSPRVLTPPPDELRPKLASALLPQPAQEMINRIIKEFTADLNAEAQKVESFYTIKEKEGRDTLARLKVPWSDTCDEEHRQKWKDELTHLTTMLENLQEYSKANIAGFRKILKKFDKQMRTRATIKLWKSIADFKFAKSEMDEVTLADAKLLWRKRIPAMPLEPTEEMPAVETEEIPTISHLDLAALPGGSVSRFWVQIAESALADHIRVPVIVVKGVKEGPVVGITAALHGNELNGIPLIHRLIRELNCKQFHGTLVAVPVTNTPGYLRSIRTFSDGTDLNRILPGKANGSSPQVYGHNLMHRIIKHFDYLLDLHTASKGRVNSLYVRADMLSPRTRKMATLQNPQIIVHNTKVDGSLRGAAMDLGISAITVEIGDPSRFQKRFVKNALLGVSNILAHLKMVPSEPDVPEYEPVVCSRSFWIFSDKGGILTVVPEIYTWCRKGEPIAYVHSLFGGLLKTYFAPEDGIVIGKSIDPVCESGSRILHLGVVEEGFAVDASDGHL